MIKLHQIKDKIMFQLTTYYRVMRVIYIVVLSEHMHIKNSISTRYMPILLTLITNSNIKFLSTNALLSFNSEEEGKLRIWVGMCTYATRWRRIKYNQAEQMLSK